MTQKIRWSEADIKKLKRMTREGLEVSQISRELGRTPGAITFKKSQIGIKTRVKKTPRVIVPKTSVKDGAKVMAKVARHIARANGKRITMAMFFVENL